LSFSVIDFILQYITAFSDENLCLNKTPVQSKGRGDRGTTFIGCATMLHNPLTASNPKGIGFPYNVGLTAQTTSKEIAFT